MKKIKFLKKLLVLALALIASSPQMWVNAAKVRYIYCGISNTLENNKNNSQFGFNFWGGTEEGVKSATWIQDLVHDGRNYHVYRVQVYDNNNMAQAKIHDTWWEPGSGTEVTLNGTNNNAVFFSHKDDGWSGQFQRDFQVTSTAELSASSTSVAIGTNVTLTPSLSSNATYNEIKSTSYSVSTNPNSAGSVNSSGVFSATQAGSYTVTATVTYNAKDFTGITKTTTATIDITVYSTVTLNTNTGTADGSATVEVGATSLTINTAPTNTATGYINRGYYEEAGCTNLVATTGGTLQKSTTYTDSDGKWTTTSNATLYTKWSNVYTVTLNDHDATVHGNTSATATYNSAMPNISVPSKTGYIFGGYYTGEGGSGTKYYNENGTSARNWDRTSDTELHAKWTGITYQVAFDANEGTGTMANQNFTYGAAATALTTNTYTRSGYYFLGWNTYPDGSGTKFYDGKSVQNLTSTAGGIVTLYAQWAKTQTLYFLNLGVADWQNASGDQASTVRYAYAYISYDGHEMHPLGDWDDDETQGTRMTASSTISIPNVSGGTPTWSWSIADVPEGATVVFSDNTRTKKTSNLSGWTAEKPYYCTGNGTWYALDSENTISKMTEMSVYVNGAFHGINKHGSDYYAIVEFNDIRNYNYKYYNWYANPGTWSGNAYKDSYIITGSTTSGISPTWSLNGDKGGHDVLFAAPFKGEYKFKLTWDNTTPQTTLCYPVGVTLEDLDETDALEGSIVTVTLSATPGATYLITNPTYYYQISTDGGNTWTTIAETSSTTYAYTFAAQKCKFRVILKNDEGLKSTSGTQDFTTYSTKSFYVYNPYNNSTNNWRWLHLYTWDSNNGNTLYNGTWDGTWGYINCTDPVGTKCTNCENGNEILAKGGDWFYITIDERANCFMLVGESPYNSHQTVTCYVSDYIQDGKYMIYTDNNQNKVVEYQTKSASDYRLKYTYGSAKERYSPIYNTILDGTEVTASMWMDASSGTSLAIQQGSTTGVWTDKVTYTNSSNGFGGIVPSDKRDKGYVFQMTLNFNTSTPTSSAVSTPATIYDGPYYVRTDALDGGWNVYKKADHTMHYTDLATDYDYYLCKWVGSAGTNVKFTIGNNYNPELVESLEDDDILGDDVQTLPRSANVRFSWNSSTNVLKRAYISGSAVVADRFLVLEGDSKLFNENGTALNITDLSPNQKNFTDDLNWLYEVNVKAKPGAKVKLTAKYNNQFQYFYGGLGSTASDSVVLLGGTGDLMYKMRIVYDFKTNRLIKAFIPEGTITSDIAIEADLMIIREHQGDAQQIQFDENGALSVVKTVYGAMKFNKWTVNGKEKDGAHAATGDSQYKRDLFWISFPFEVKLKDAFGFGEYGTHWILEYYDGKGRAKNGFWVDSEPNWKFVMPSERNDFTMNAFEGYILALDLDQLGESSEVWDNGVEDVYVYFPSSDSVRNISATSRTIKIDQNGYQCNIGPRFVGGDDRRIKDSYWHCIGVPSYANASHAISTSDVPDDLDEEESWEPDPSLLYFYEWNSSNNSLLIKKTSPYTFKAMHSYMVQYAGPTITWSSVNVTPASVAARITETPDREYKLELINGDEVEDQTFIRLTDDANVTTGFEFNYDLCKEMNKNRANIYTLISTTIDSVPSITEAAANVQPHPLSTTIVPVGVKIAANGEYTFTMPEGTNGENVWLLDNQTGSRTNLGLMDYTVNLTAGTIDGRFALEFGPIQDAPTGIDEMSTVNSQLSTDSVRKVFVGGRLYIIRDGKAYDATGKRVE